jgi:hypothetical protein
MSTQAVQSAMYRVETRTFFGTSFAVSPCVEGPVAGNPWRLA